MKKIISCMLALIILFSICNAENGKSDPAGFGNMNDPALLPYMEETVYQAVLDNLENEDYLVENISAIYISDEYLEELAFNSQSNIYFGFTLEELNNQFQGDKYVFTLSSTNETIVEPWTAYDDTMERVIRNVAIGTGVILVCVTVSAVTAGAGAPAISMIFAVAAKSGAQCALSGGLLGAFVSGGIEYVKTGNSEKALKAAAVGGSESFKWGAIIGSVAGGANEFSGLRGARMNGLKMNDAARIQKESKLPLQFIKNFHSVDEYNIYKKAGLVYDKLGDSYFFTRNIDLNSVITDNTGKAMTNADRIRHSLSPVDANGIPYELHHIGQQPDSPLAILTKAEHIQGGNNKILHFRDSSEVDHGADWVKQVSSFWKEYLSKYGGV